MRFRSSLIALVATAAAFGGVAIGDVAPVNAGPSPAHTGSLTVTGTLERVAVDLADESRHPLRPAQCGEDVVAGRSRRRRTRSGKHRRGRRHSARRHDDRGGVAARHRSVGRGREPARPRTDQGPRDARLLGGQPAGQSDHGGDEATHHHRQPSVVRRGLPPSLHGRRLGDALAAHPST